MAASRAASKRRRNRILGSSQRSRGIRLPREDVGPSRNSPWKVTQKPFEKASRGGGVFRFYRTSQARKDQHRNDYAGNLADADSD